MKKINRSHSSYRIEKYSQPSDNSQNQYWMSNVRQNNGTSKIVNSIIHNNALHQSVSQKSISPQYQTSNSELNHIDAVKYFHEKSIKYNEEIERQKKVLKSQEKNHFSFNNSKNYDNITNPIQNTTNPNDRSNSSPNPYTEEGESINWQINSKSGSQDKNLYIKQINNKNIQIHKLEDLVKLYKSEKQTLTLYLKEKQSLIQELQQKIGQIDMRKKKIQHYQSQYRESQEFLKDLEAQTQKFKQQSELKDKVINDKSRLLMKMEERMMEDEDKMRKIEESLIKLNEERKTQRERSQQWQRQCDKWKESYEKELSKREQIKQMEIKLQNCTRIIEDLKKRNIDLVSITEKSKTVNSSLDKMTQKYQQMEKECLKVKRASKEKDEIILNYENKQKIYKEMQQTLAKTKKQRDDVTMKLHEKNKQVKSLNLTVEDLNSKIISLTEQITEMQDNNSRQRQRKEGMDSVIKENTRLTSTLVDKINQIQKLQHKSNNLQNKICNLSNENSKLKLINEDNQIIINEQTLQINSLRDRYQQEMNHRLSLDQKILRMSQEMLSYRSNITRLEDEYNQIRLKAEEDQMSWRNEYEHIKIYLNQIDVNKKEYEESLSIFVNKIQTLKNQAKQFKRMIEDLTLKQKDHRNTMAALEFDLQATRAENDQLKANRRQIHTSSTSIRDLAADLLRICATNQSK